MLGKKTAGNEKQDSFEKKVEIDDGHTLHDDDLCVQSEQ